MTAKTAVVITNLGTPENLDVASVKQFLKQFLSDGRVVEIPKIVWWFILNGIILPFRSPKTLEAYRRVWTDQGSPLIAICQRQQQALQHQLGEKTSVKLAMRYGNPSFKSVINELIDNGFTRLVVLPLYPQNSATTTATTFHHLTDVIAHRRDLPSIHFINDYHEDDKYIDALVASIREFEESNEKRHLLMSFHGLPQVNVDKGDPYYNQCLRSAELLANKLELGAEDWSLGFQSRFGAQVWLKPYTSDVLEDLIKRDIKKVNVICPGFSADCLETLDEIEVEYREMFIDAGGEAFSYIPALNDRDDHVEMMAGLISPHIAQTG